MTLNFRKILTTLEPGFSKKAVQFIHAVIRLVTLSSSIEKIFRDPLLPFVPDIKAIDIKL